MIIRFIKFTLLLFVAKRKSEHNVRFQKYKYRNSTRTSGQCRSQQFWVGQWKDRQYSFTRPYVILFHPWHSEINYLQFDL